MENESANANWDEIEKQKSNSSYKTSSSSSIANDTMSSAPAKPSTLTPQQVQTYEQKIEQYTKKTGHFDVVINAIKTGYELAVEIFGKYYQDIEVIAFFKSCPC